MCQNNKFIRNKYDGREYFVPCGHCESCRQERANRHVKRILHEQMTSSSIGVFITLSYENDYVPYILKSEVDGFINNPFDFDLSVRRGNNDNCIFSFSYDDFLDNENQFYLNGLNTDFKFIRKKCRNGKYKVLNDRVSVVYLRDIQLFFKRLKINLFRSGYQGYFSYYYASEYGERYNRAHFHILAFVDKEYYDKFKLLVNKSWPYADLLKFRKGENGFRQSIEVAKNPAKYVASYLNCSSYLPSFLQKVKPFKPFTHFSNGFGCFLSEFSLSSIIEKVNRGNLRYNYTKVVGGLSTVCSARIPKYVLSRYFPKFKGYSLVSSDEIIRIIEQPGELYKCKRIVEKFGKDDLDNIFNFVCNLRKRAKNFNTDCIFEDWLFTYPRVWSIYASESIVDSYNDVQSYNDLWYHFDNINVYYSGDVRNDFLDNVPLPSFVVPNPNDFPLRKARTDKLKKDFQDSVKHHVIKNSYYEKSFAI